MRRVLVAVGLALTVAALLLWTIPVASGASSSVPPGGAEIVPAALELAPFTHSVPFEVTWSTDAGGEVQLTVYDCSDDSTCSNVGANSTPLVVGHGASGRITWTGTKGNYYAIVALFPGGSVRSSTSISITAYAPFLSGLAGVTLLPIGAASLLFGLVRPARPPLGPSPTTRAEPASSPPPAELVRAEPPSEPR